MDGEKIYMVLKELNFILGRRGVTDPSYHDIQNAVGHDDNNDK